MANRNLTLKLNVSAAAVKESFKQLSANTQTIVGGTKKWKEALVGVNAQLQQGRANIAATYAKMTPDTLGKRVKLQLAQEEASGKLQEAEAKERAKQYQPKTLLGRLGKALGFDTSPGNKGESSMLGGLGKSLGLGSEAAALLGGISKALGPIGIAVTALTVGVATFQKFVGETMKLVQLADPGAVKRFNMAWEDTLAVIGHKLTPLVDFWTKELRLLGDFIASVLPSEKEMREALAPLEDVLTDMRSSLEDIAPLVKQVFVELMQEGAFYLKIFAEEMKVWIFLLEAMVAPMALAGGKKKPLLDSTGAAARPVSFQDSTAYAKSIYQAIGSQKGKDPAEKTAENTKETNDLLRGFWDWFKGIHLDAFNDVRKFFSDFHMPDFHMPDFHMPDFHMPDFAGQLSDAADKIPQAIKDALGDLPNRIAKAIKDNLPSLPDLPNPFGGGGGPGVIDQVGDAIGNAARRAREKWLGFFG